MNETGLFSSQISNGQRCSSDHEQSGSGQPPEPTPPENAPASSFLSQKPLGNYHSEARVGVGASWWEKIRPAESRRAGKTGKERERVSPPEADQSVRNRFLITEMRRHNFLLKVMPSYVSSPAPLDGEVNLPASSARCRASLVSAQRDLLLLSVLGWRKDPNPDTLGLFSGTLFGGSPGGLICADFPQVGFSFVAFGVAFWCP